MNSQRFAQYDPLECRMSFDELLVFIGITTAINLFAFFYTIRKLHGKIDKILVLDDVVRAQVGVTPKCLLNFAEYFS